jgi:hypothetical protein
MEYVTVTKEKYAALLAVVEAARAFLKPKGDQEIDGWDPADFDEWPELLALRAALARLEEPA